MNIQELEKENAILKQKLKEKGDFNYEIACKFYKLKTRINLHIKNPLTILLNRNDKLKEEYKLDYINKELILKILEEIETLNVEIK